jgi:cyclase
MNRNIRFILMPAFFLLVSTTLGWQGDNPPVEFQKISDRLFQVVGGRGAHGGVYIGDDAVLVIDAKMDETSVQQVIEGIKKLTDKPIRYLVNTHSDGDHITGNRYFPATVTFIAHENCRKDLFLPGRNSAPSQWSAPELAPFVPSITFTDKMVIHLGSRRVELWYFGVGHTTGDAVVYFPEEKTAFVGDQLFLTRPQLIHAYKGGNSLEHVKTLSKMLDTLDAERFYSGHSDIADRNDVAHQIEQMKQRQAKVKTSMAQGKSVAEIQSQFDEDQARLIQTICTELSNSSEQ